MTGSPTTASGASPGIRCPPVKGPCGATEADLDEVIAVSGLNDERLVA